MADGGASVGSIKGLLELDISDYMDNMQRAKMAEDELKNGDRDVTIGANVEDAIAKIDDVNSKVKELGADNPDVTVDASVDDAVAKIDDVQAKLDETDSQAADIHVDANIDDAQSKLDEVSAKSAEIDAQQYQLRVDAKVDEALNQIDAVATAAQSLDAKPASIQVDANTGKAVAQITAVKEAEADLEMATARLKAGYESLDAVESDGVASQSTLMVQEAAIGRLEDEHTAAQERLTAACKQYDVQLIDSAATTNAMAAEAAKLDAQKIDMRVDANVDAALAHIDEVATAAMALDAKPARIQVDADTGRATAQIVTVKEAEANLEMATARLKAAYGQLDSVQSRDVASQSALMTAEAAATRLEDEQANALERLNAACSQYGVRMTEDTAAISAASAATEADTSATDSDTAAKDANKTAADSQAASAHSLTGALMLVAPALVPIAGAAAGAGVALVGMAAVGVLAVKGISMAMSDGSVTGQQYSADLKSVYANITQLERTGAPAFLDGMNAMTAELSAKMPFLETATATYSRDLGTMSGDAVAGILGLFQQLTPVTISVDQGLLHASQSLKNWGTGSGAQQFVEYLLEQLPIVSTSLGSLVTAVGHVITAFSPLGDMVLEAITGVSNAISAIPTPLLTTLAAGALGAYAGFKTWQAISPIIDSVRAAIAGIDGASLMSMVTPIGAVIAAVGLLGAAFMAFSDKTETAAGAQNDFLQALEKSNGAIDANVRSTVAKSAADSDMTSLSSQVGVSASQVTDAILNQGDAYDTVKKKVEANVSAADQFRTQNGYNSKSLTDTANASSSLLDKLDQLRGKYSSAASEQKFLASASADTTTTLSNQAQILGLSQSQWDALSGAEASASSAAKDYKSALDALNGQSQTLDQATSTLTTQFDTMASTIKQNIKQVGAAQATSMDNNTVYGAKNHQLILQTVQDAQSEADAIINSEGKSQKSYEDARASLETSRQKILQVARANGLNTDAVSKYLDQVMKLPADAKTSIILDDSEAVGGLKELQVKTAEVTSDGKHVTITGDNEDALAKIAAVTGAKINKKTGTLTLDKTQYDIALALANGAKINKKTGILEGDDSGMLAKVAEANGWKINRKTGIITGDDGQYLSVKNQVDSLRINPKTGGLFANDQASGVISKVNSERLNDKSMNIVTNFINNTINKTTTVANGVTKNGGYTGGMFNGSSFLPGYADGGAFDGAVTGPDSPIKDNVILRNARLNPGEHVLTVDDVKAMGGQKAVYAFRSSLHQSQSTGYTGGDTSGSNATGKTGGGVSLPEFITLVDADGSILAKVRAIVGEANGRRNTSLVRALVN